MTQATRTAVTFQRYELLRVLRNTRFFLFSLAFPLILFLLVAGPNRDESLGGIPFPVYYLAGMVSWGTMAGVVGAGARIAGERAVGWNRQLRLTPLTAPTYLASKVAGGYLTALLSMVILFAAGAAVGVRLGAGRWLLLTGLVLVGLIPFAALGIWLGHLLTPDSIGPAMGGVTALFALLGGAWGPLATSGFMLQVAQALPSYWLVQAGHAAISGDAWPAKGWLVIAVWGVVFAVQAGRAYQRDTRRV